MSRDKFKLTLLHFDEVTDKLVFEFPIMHKNATLTIKDIVFEDAFNDCEPYDRKSHVFYVPSQLLDDKTKLKITVRDFISGKLPVSHTFTFGNPEYKTREQADGECDNRLELKNPEIEIISDGVEYRHYIAKNKKDMPVHIFALIADMNINTLYTGTPFDGYADKKVKQTIPGMIEAAVKNGHEVTASINGDFFDIFGDMHPSGLVVKNGKLVANPSSKRPFVCVKKDGTALIADSFNNPGIIPKLQTAVAGLQRIVKNSECFDTAPIESFGYTPHPRSAAGVTKDGKAVLVVVDGRIPDYSNGATLKDLAEIMLKLGCTDAINIDGGGSSAIYVKHGDEFELRSTPADLQRPNDKLIRKEANCIMIIKK